MCFPLKRTCRKLATSLHQNNPHRIKRSYEQRRLSFRKENAILQKSHYSCQEKRYFLMNFDQLFPFNKEDIKFKKIRFQEIKILKRKDADL